MKRIIIITLVLILSTLSVYWSPKGDCPYCNGHNECCLFWVTDGQTGEAHHMTKEEQAEFLREEAER